MQQAGADTLIGRTLEGRYRILERIARGGMSTVYSAIDERLDRLVAVKVMSAALSADPAFSDRFTREARAAARLSHLNTVSVYDQGTDLSNGTPHVFLVMELVDGRTLRDLIRERGPLSVPQAVSIMEPVLSALAAAHRAGIVHRDVKPENILLSDDGVVKVADFGLARAIESEAAATRTGLMMGTVAYCAPEQISVGRADQRSDVYAAGVVFFELLTGTTPYTGESAMTIAYQHVHSRVPAPSSRVHGVPEEIDEIVIAATDSDPDGRPSDAAEFLAELAEIRSKLAMPVLAVPPRQRPAPSVARSAAAVLGRQDGATTAEIVRDRHDHVDLAANATSVVPRSGYPAADRPPPPPPPIVTPPRKRVPPSPKVMRRRRALITLAILVVLGLAAGYTGWWFAAGRYGQVPNVEGSSIAVATKELRDAGYKVSSTINRAFSETVPTGAVVGTDPDIGSRKPHGSTITLVVSKGKERYTIPKTAGGTVAQAQTALTAIPVQIAPATTEQSSLTVPAGKVINTSPAAGVKVKRNSVVTILVSTGPPIIGIPNIDPGAPVDAATQALITAGFKVKRVDEFSDTIPKDGVISVSPTGTAPQQSTITLTVSKGPRTVVIPTFGNLTPLDEVKTKLEDLGLVVKVKKAFGGNSGLVVGIDPPSGTTVEVGSTVTVTIV